MNLALFSIERNEAQRIICSSVRFFPTRPRPPPPVLLLLTLWLPAPLRSEGEEDDESADGCRARGDILMTDELCSAVERKKKKKTEKKETNLGPRAMLASVRV